MVWKDIFVAKTEKEREIPKEDDSSIIKERVLKTVSGAIRDHQVAAIYATGGEFLSREEKDDPINSITMVNQFYPPGPFYGRKLSSGAWISRLPPDALSRLTEEPEQKWSREIVEYLNEELPDHALVHLVITDQPVADYEVITQRGSHDLYTAYNNYLDLAGFSEDKERQKSIPARAAILVSFLPAEQIITPEDPPDTWRKRLEAQSGEIGQSPLLLVNMTTNDFSYIAQWKGDEYMGLDNNKSLVGKSQMIKGLEKVEKVFRDRK